MKKTTLLTLAVGLMAASQLKADVDVYLTGSTAFRKNVYAAVQNMFSPAPTIKWDTAKVAGGDGTSGNGNPVWTMTGTAANIFTNGSGSLISGTLNIHGNFTGSVQGIQDVESGSQIYFLDKNGNLSTNIPDVAFSDVSSASVPFPLDQSSYEEDNVAIQPFVFCKSISTASVMTNISNVTWEQGKAIVKAGKLPACAWSAKGADTNNYIYLVNRTKDSGTRRTTFGELDFAYQQTCTVYVYTNGVWTGYASTITGNNTNQVIGSSGFANNNYGWGPGWVGGSDVQGQMQINSASNTSICYLSFADAQKAGSGSSPYWTQVLPYNGVWPTAVGSSLTNANTGTTYNDFSPIIYGQYPFWATEVIVYPTAALPSGQNLTLSQLGTSTSPGTFLGVFNAQSNSGLTGTTPLPGSVEYEIYKSEGNAGGSFPNTAIRLVEMTASRQFVGGILAP